MVRSEERVAMGRAVGNKWDARFEGYDFDDVEFNSFDSRMRIISIDPHGARDTDHDRCRTLHIDVDVPSWQVISDDFIQLRGYVSQVRRYPEGEGVPVDELCDGGKYCKIGKEHPFSDNYLPPVDGTFRPGVYEINLRRY